MRNVHIIFLAACATVLAVTAGAFAQSAEINIGDIIRPWTETLLSAFVVFVSAILTWIATLIRSKTGFDIEARHREALQAALTNAAGLVLNKLADKADSVTIDARHPLIAEAVQYVNTYASDAVKHFDVWNSQIAEKVLAKIGLATAPHPAPAE